MTRRSTAPAAILLFLPLALATAARRPPHNPSWYTSSRTPVPNKFPLCIVAIALLALEVPVHAYIDPGSTGLLLQGLIGGIAAAIVLTRSWWQRGIARLRGPGRRSAGGREGGRKPDETDAK